MCQHNLVPLIKYACVCLRPLILRHMISTTVQGYKDIFDHSGWDVTLHQNPYGWPLINKYNPLYMSLSFCDLIIHASEGSTSVMLLNLQKIKAGWQKSCSVERRRAEKMTSPLYICPVTQTITLSPSDKRRHISLFKNGDVWLKWGRSETVCLDESRNMHCILHEHFCMKEPSGLLKDQLVAAN